MDNKYEQLSDKYITLLTEVQVFIDKLQDELQEPKEDILNNIEELTQCYNKLFNSNYYKGKRY